MNKTHGDAQRRQLSPNESPSSHFTCPPQSLVFPPPFSCLPPNKTHTRQRHRTQQNTTQIFSTAHGRQVQQVEHLVTVLCRVCTCTCTCGSGCCCRHALVTARSSAAARQLLDDGLELALGNDAAVVLVAQHGLEPPTLLLQLLNVNLQRLPQLPLAQEVLLDEADRPLQPRGHRRRVVGARRGSRACCRGRRAHGCGRGGAGGGGCGGRQGGGRGGRREGGRHDSGERRSNARGDGEALGLPVFALVFVLAVQVGQHVVFDFGGCEQGRHIARRQAGKDLVLVLDEDAGDGVHAGGVFHQLVHILLLGQEEVRGKHCCEVCQIHLVDRAALVNVPQELAQVLEQSRVAGRQRGCQFLDKSEPFVVIDIVNFDGRQERVKLLKRQERGGQLAQVLLQQRGYCVDLGLLQQVGLLASVEGVLELADAGGAAGQAEEADLVEAVVADAVDAHLHNDGDGAIQPALALDLDGEVGAEHATAEREVDDSPQRVHPPLKVVGI
eukprot:m.165905 g.165905  ORF g.165905 m.165905 type:complete len:498 (-) comp17163_c0_seq1:825-2318(-)